MSKALILLFLALGGIAACSRPVNKAVAVQPVCKGSQTPAADNCQRDLSALGSPGEERTQVCSDGSRILQSRTCPAGDTRTAAEVCAANPTAAGCPGSTSLACTQAGLASGGDNNSCISLLVGPCGQNNRIEGMTTYCSPAGYVCSQMDSKVSCARSQPQTNPDVNWGTVANKIGEGLDACLSGASASSLCTARIPDRDKSGKLIFSNADQLDSAHGDKYLLISLNKNTQGIYSLYLDARDRDVANIKVRYLKDTAFNGLKGPSIKAEILWEVRGQTCHGKETVFTLENNLKPKPLNAICEGTTR
ncbi:MAG: hypothetical protein WCI18_09505 [Pseudomonadota bacterium]